MIAKCRPRILHHWAHAGRRNCDPWWENETEWHRAWKNLFPESCREIGHVAPDDEIHRADIKTPTGIVIEVQHSAMTDAERQSREDFYGNLVWVIDGRGFRDNFDIYHLLPAPESEIAQDLVWCKASRPMQGAARGLFFRLSEGQAEFPDETITKATMRGGFRSALLDGSLPLVNFFSNLILPLWDAKDDKFGIARIIRAASPLASASALKDADDQFEQLAEAQAA